MKAYTAKDGTTYHKHYCIGCGKVWACQPGCNWDREAPCLGCAPNFPDCWTEDGHQTPFEE